MQRPNQCVGGNEFKQKCEVKDQRYEFDVIWLTSIMSNPTVLTEIKYDIYSKVHTLKFVHHYHLTSTNLCGENLQAIHFITAKIHLKK